MIIGIDPDSKTHGVAFYDNAGLIDLKNLTLPELVEYMVDGNKFAIENVSANNSIFIQKHNSNKNIQTSMGRRLGKCQQAEIELVRFLESKNIPYKMYKPSKQWKKGRQLIERFTGWNKPSNEDTRSAAYFGFLEWKRCNTK